MCDSSSVLPVLSLLVQGANTGMGVYNTVQAGQQARDSGEIPRPVMPDTTAAIRKQLPQTRANASANLGGGFAPGFLEAMAANEAGYPGASDLGLLEELRRQLRPTESY